MYRISLSVALALALGLVLAIPAAPAQAATGLIVGDYARLTRHDIELRSGPGVTHSALYSIDKGEIVRLTAAPAECLAVDPCPHGWYRVRHRSQQGYLPAAALAYTGLAGRKLARNYARVIVVSLPRQQMEVYVRGKLVMITPVTTGKPATPTPPGTFRIASKKSPYVFRSPNPPDHPEWYAPSPVKMAIRYGTRDYYLHDAPWRPAGGYGYGTNEYHMDPDGRIRQGSHGCTNIPLKATKWLWKWVRLGDYVRVVDY